MRRDQVGKKQFKLGTSFEANLIEATSIEATPSWRQPRPGGHLVLEATSFKRQPRSRGHLILEVTLFWTTFLEACHAGGDLAGGNLAGGDLAGAALPQSRLARGRLAHGNLARGRSFVARGRPFEAAPHLVLEGRLCPTRSRCSLGAARMQRREPDGTLDFSK